VAIFGLSNDVCVEVQCGWDRWEFGVDFGLDTAGCVELHCVELHVGWWFILWIGYCCLCRGTLFIFTRGMVVYFVNWILLAL
jgi:hypothetical protein